MSDYKAIMTSVVLLICEKTYLLSLKCLYFHKNPIGSEGLNCSVQITVSESFELELNYLIQAQGIKMLG